MHSPLIVGLVRPQVDTLDTMSEAVHATNDKARREASAALRGARRGEGGQGHRE